MIRTILNKLNGSSDDPASLQLALAQLGVERKAATDAIADVQQKRRQALLDDEDDKILDRLERELARAQVRVEKLDAAEPLLQQRLVNAKAVAHAAAVDKHVAIIEQHYHERLRTAMLAAEAAALTMANLRAAATAEVGEHQLNTAIPVVAYGGFIGRGFIAPWIEDMDKLLVQSRGARERRRGIPAPQLPAPAPRVSKPKPAVENPLGGRVGLGRQGVAPQPAKRMPDDLSALAPDQTRVRVLRGGFSPSDDAPQCSGGQIIRMSTSAAHAAAKSGAVALLEETKGPPSTGASPTEAKAHG